MERLREGFAEGHRWFAGLVIVGMVASGVLPSAVSEAPVLPSVPAAVAAPTLAPPASMALDDVLTWAAAHLPPSLEGPRAALATLSGFLPAPMSLDLPRPLRFDAAAVASARRVTPDAFRGAVEIRELWVVEGDLDLRGAALRFGADGGLLVRGTLRIHDTTVIGLGPTGATSRVQVDAALELLRAVRAPEEALQPLLALRDRLGENYVYAAGPVDVRNATFAGAGLTLLPSAERAVIEDARFVGGTYGLLAARSDLRVERSSFMGLHIGLGLSGAPRSRPGADAVVHDAEPEVANTTFEMNGVGFIVYDGAGTFHHLVARANHVGISCRSPGYLDENGDLHRALFRDSNLYTNLGDAIGDVRGAAIPDPFNPGNTITLAENSACDYDHDYLGPAGNARDSTFLSVDDTLTNVEAQPVATSAPPLSMPLTEITSETTWTTPHELNGPVVVTSPGKLTIKTEVTARATANVTETYFESYWCGCYITRTHRQVVSPSLGAKAKGLLTLDGAHIGYDALRDTSPVVSFRNDADTARDSRFGERVDGMAFGGAGVLMYRCNCTVRDSVMDTTSGVSALSGMLVDDVQWTPRITNVTFHAGVALTAAANVKPTLEASDIRAFNGVSQALLSSVVLSDNTFRVLGNGYTGAIATTMTSTGDRFEGGQTGILGVLLDADTVTNGLIGNTQLGAANLLGTYTQSLTNVTLNHLGIYPGATNAAVSNSNFVDNVVAAGAVPLDVNGVTVGSVSCANCYAPPDEVWADHVTWTAALAPNAVARPSWDAAQRIALDGQTVDLDGALDQGPAIARSGGTLRVRDASLALNERFPLLVKGGGMDGGATGKLVLENASLTWAYTPRGYEDFDQGAGWFDIRANSTDSHVTQSTFAGFGGSPFRLAGNGFGTIECVDWESWYAPLVAFDTAPGASQLTLRRVRVTNSSGVTLSADGGLLLPPPAGTLDGTVLVEDSSIRALHATPGGGDHGPLVWRGMYRPDDEGAGKPIVRHSNLLGPKAAPGVYDSAYARNLTAFDARENYWGDPEGPNRNGSAGHSDAWDAHLSDYVPMLTDGFAAQPYAPKPCMAWDVLTSVPLDEAPVLFRDRSFDPSGLAATRTWSWGDGTTLNTGALDVAHQFATWGTYTVNLTLASDSGGSDTLRRDVRVLARPVPSFTTTPALPVETDDIAFQSTSLDPDGSVTAWSWEFGDGATATGATPRHRYAEGGAKTVTLTVTDNDGLKQTLVTAVEVAHAPPVPDFTFTRAQLEVQFQDASGHPNAADVPSAGWAFAWDLGDGTLSTERNPAHAYAAQDVYNVTLKVTDDDGMSATVTKPLDLRNQPPVADWSVVPQVPVMGGEASFHDDSTDPDGTVVAWLWDFGDGATSTAQHPTHTFADGGDYVVSLRVTDNQGGIATRTRTVHVCETGLQQGGGGIHLEVCSQVTLADLLGTAWSAPAQASALVEAAEDSLPSLEQPALPPL